MKITAHPDGTYTLSGLTTEDVRDLSFGHCAAAAWHATHQGNDPDYSIRARNRHDRANHFLNDAVDGESRLRLRNGRSQSRTLETEVVR